MAEHENILDDTETVASVARNTRLGLRLFFVYLVMYTGFVLINTFAPQLMERDVFAGVNLAITYGFALILAALFLALLYGWMCRSRSADSASEQAGDKPA